MQTAEFNVIGWTVKSYGNGLAYEIGCYGKSFFVQGDDAAQLRDDWDKCDQLPNELHARALNDLFWSYMP